MKIIDKNRIVCYFADLKNGDVFVFDKEVYIKVIDKNQTPTPPLVDVVNLSNGEGRCFNNGVVVEKVNAKLVIE